MLSVNGKPGLGFEQENAFVLLLNIEAGSMAIPPERYAQVLTPRNL